MYKTRSFVALYDFISGTPFFASPKGHFSASPPCFVDLYVWKYVLHTFEMRWCHPVVEHLSLTPESEWICVEPRKQGLTKTSMRRDETGPELQQWKAKKGLLLGGMYPFQFNKVNLAEPLFEPPVLQKLAIPSYTRSDTMISSLWAISWKRYLPDMFIASIGLSGCIAECDQCDYET